MDRVKQSVMVKDFLLKGHGSKLIHKELVSTLQDSAISQELVQEIQIRRSFLCRRRMAQTTFDFFGSDSSALSEEVSLNESSSNGRAFLGGSGYHQEHP
jgi:hypothetical protein